MDIATKTAADRKAAPWRHIALLAALVAAMGLVHALTAAFGLLSGDEAYYWLWSRQLQLSYFDHPGMAAWWLAGTTALFGTSELAVRLPSILASGVVTVLIYDITRRAFDSSAAGLTAALWINLTLLFGAASVIATPDAPLLVFWSLALWAMVRLMREDRPVWLYVAAVALGLGFTGKYTMVLILPGLLSLFVLFRQGWRWWRRLHHLVLAALLALACTAPVLVWNWRHEWISFRKQLSHSFDSPVTDPLANLAVFAGTQVGLVTPLLFGFCVWGMGWALWAGWRRRRAEWFLLGATSAPVLAFFLNHTLGGVVQPHWAGPAWIGGIAAAAGGWSAIGGRLRPGPRWILLRRLYIAAPALAAALLAVVYLHMATAIVPIPPKMDPLGRLGGWDTLGEAVQTQRVQHPDTFVFVPKHELSGLLSYYLPGHPMVFLTGSKGVPRIPSYDAADVAALAGRNGLFVARTGRNSVEEVSGHFERVTLLEVVERRWGGRLADRYEIWLCESYQPGLFQDRREEQ